jgi:uncharacterized OB-fold protein
MTVIRPTAAVLAEPFWEGLRCGKLLLERCLSCGSLRHPPSPMCPTCRSFDATWEPATGEGTVNTFTVVHHPVHPLLESWVPYNVALVQLVEGPLIVSTVRVRAPDELVVGAQVTCSIEPISDDLSLPIFRPSP